MPRWVCKLLLGWEVLAGNISGVNSLFCLLSTYCCITLEGLKLPPIPTYAGVSKCAETFRPSWLAPWVRVPVPNSFVSFYLYLLPYLILRRLACLFGSLRSSASIQKVLCMSCFMCTCIFDTFVGRKVISPSSSSAILKVSHLRSYYSS